MDNVRVREATHRDNYALAIIICLESHTCEELLV